MKNEEQKLANEVDRQRHIFIKYGDKGRNIPAGYTYLGQMIAHDIVPETQVSPERVGQHQVKPILNLSSIYGESSKDDELSDELLFCKEQFRIEKRLCDEPHAANAAHRNEHYIEDFRRCKDGVPKIPELRDDENTIVSQLHLLWMRFHNKLQEASGSSKEEVREQVVKVFQSVIVSDFMRLLLVPEVFDFYFRHGKSSNNKDRSSEPWFIPQEFSLAAFRFGHSMVLSEYMGFGPDDVKKKLQEIFRRNEKLTCSMQINWSAFFAEKLDLGRNQSEKEGILSKFLNVLDLLGFPGFQNLTKTPVQRFANSIDEKITEAMFEIPSPRCDEDPIDLIGANLRASLRESMPTGYDCRNIAKTRLENTELDAQFNAEFELEENQLNDANKRILKTNRRFENEGQTDFFDLLEIEELALWPYLLLEAGKHGGGSGLGPLGSILVAETISTSIKRSHITIWDDENNEFKLLSLGKDGKQFKPSNVTSFDRDHIETTDRNENFITPIMSDVLKTINS